MKVTAIKHGTAKGNFLGWLNTRQQPSGFENRTGTGSKKEFTPWCKRSKALGHWNLHLRMRK